MSATTDVVLAAGPTIVALAAIGAAVWQQGRGLKHERELADLASVRSVLDEAALALHRVGALPMSLLLEEDSYEQVESAVNTDLEPIRSRLTVRLGQSHSLVRKFTEAMEALTEWSTEALYLSLEPDEGGPRGTDRRNRQTALDKIGWTYSDAAAAFLDLAAKSAGARLP